MARIGVRFMGLKNDEIFAILSKGIRGSSNNGGVMNPDDYYNKNQVDTMFQELRTMISMSPADMEATLLPNKLYVFPEMERLNINLMQIQTLNYQEYNFIFGSGSTPTALVLPGNIVSDLYVEPNRIYEVSIVNNLLAWRSWAVNS